MAVKEYCCGFLFARDKVALVRKAKPAWQAGKLNGVGGKIEEGETPIQAMAREFREETGVSFEAWEEFAIVQGATGGPRWRVHFFRGFSEQEYELKGVEGEPVGWYHAGPMIAALPTIPNLRWLVPLARLQKLAAPVLVLDADPDNE